MSAWPAVIVIVTVDVLLPALLAAWLIVVNVRRHRSRRHEVSFWALCLVPLVFLFIAVVRGIAGIFVFDGGFVAGASLLGLPGVVVPAIATIAMSKAFFDDSSWASIGYFTVMPAYLVGLVLWQLVAITGLRRLIQRGHEGNRATRLRAPAPGAES
jgi:hypothetical protein